MSKWMGNHEFHDGCVYYLRAQRKTANGAGSAVRWTEVELSTVGRAYCKSGAAKTAACVAQVVCRGGICMAVGRGKQAYSLSLRTLGTQ